MATNIKDIRKGILKYFFLSNALTKQKRKMRHMMRNPRGFKLQHIVARLQELNNLLPKFLRSDEYRNISQEELNNILLQVVPHRWDKQ